MGSRGTDLTIECQSILILIVAMVALIAKRVSPLSTPRLVYGQLSPRCTFVLTNPFQKLVRRSGATSQD